tara:strand:- start:115 stop:324 length:210 start_codon:yes stop_codon:yes gene_type:complete
MYSLPQAHQRIGCLALPLSTIAGFTVVTLFTASLGFSGFISTIAGLIGAATAMLIALMILRKSGEAGKR